MNKIKQFVKDHKDAVIITGVVTLNIAALCAVYSAATDVTNAGWDIEGGYETSSDPQLIKIVFKNGKTRIMERINK